MSKRLYALSGQCIGQGAGLRVASLVQRVLLCATLVLGGCASLQPSVPCHEGNTLKAEVVALEQAYVLNRFGAYVPSGMLYALKRDVEAVDKDRAVGPGNARLRSDKRPRPLVLRAHEDGCLQVTLHNWLSPT